MTRTTTTLKPAWSTLSGATSGCVRRHCVCKSGTLSFSPLVVATIEREGALHLTWCNIRIFTLVLLGISSGRCGVRTPSAYSSAFQNFRTQHPQPQPHQPPQAQGVSTAGYRAPPPEYSPPPLTTMTVPGAAAYLSSSSPSSPDMDKSGVAIEMVSPVSSSPATSSSSAGRQYDHDNRVDVIRRLCDLQQPDGHWEYSDELAGLARMWGGREVPTVAHGATALSQACLMELCDHVWAAQRDGTEDTALSADEIASLQMMHWDLGFARGALDRSTAWLSGFR